MTAENVSKLKLEEDCGLKGDGKNFELKNPVVFSLENVEFVRYEVSFSGWFKILIKVKKDTKEAKGLVELNHWLKSAWDEDPESVFFSVRYNDILKLSEINDHYYVWASIKANAKVIANDKILDPKKASMSIVSGRGFANFCIYKGWKNEVGTTGFNIEALKVVYKEVTDDPFGRFRE